MTAATHRDCYPPAGLTRVDDALALVAARVAVVAGCELVPLHKATGGILANDIRAAASSPAYDRGAMDGFAFRFDAGSIGRTLHCVGRAYVVLPFKGTVTAGECVAIATGAMLPPGCDTVVIQEQCDVAGDHVVVFGPVPGQHIRRRGEDFWAADILLPAGTRLAPQHLGLLTSAGLAEANVRRRVRVALLSIGNELSAGPAEPETAQIFDANRPMLLSFCDRIGAEVSDLVILPDLRDRIAAVLRTAAATHDVIICSAATSNGEEGHVRAAIRDCGGDILISGVAIRPGKPVSFSKIGDCLHIALLGNPTAALIAFLTIGVPLLRQVAGECRSPVPPQMVCADLPHRKRNWGARLSPGYAASGHDRIAQAHRCAKDGAAMLASLAQSHGLVWLDEDTIEIMASHLPPFARSRAS